MLEAGLSSRSRVEQSPRCTSLEHDRAQHRAARLTSRREPRRLRDDTTCSHAMPVHSCAPRAPGRRTPLISRIRCLRTTSGEPARPPILRSPSCSVQCETVLRYATPPWFRHARRLRPRRRRSRVSIRPTPYARWCNEEHRPQVRRREHARGDEARKCAACSTFRGPRCVVIGGRCIDRETHSANSVMRAARGARAMVVRWRSRRSRQPSAPALTHAPAPHLSNAGGADREGTIASEGAATAR